MNYVDPIRNQEHAHKSQISSEIRTHEQLKAMRDESQTQDDVLKQAQNKKEVVTETENLVQTNPDGGGNTKQQNKKGSKKKSSSTAEDSPKKLPPKLYGGQFIDTSA